MPREFKREADIVSFHLIFEPSTSVLFSHTIEAHRESMHVDSEEAIHSTEVRNIFAQPAKDFILT